MVRGAAGSALVRDIGLEKAARHPLGWARARRAAAGPCAAPRNDALIGTAPPLPLRHRSMVLGPAAQISLRFGRCRLFSGPALVADDRESLVVTQVAGDELLDAGYPPELREGSVSV